MAKFTLAQKADHFNSLLSSPALNKLKLDRVDKFKNHKEADELGKALFETINKQKGYRAGIADSGLIEIIKEKSEELVKPARQANTRKAKIASDEKTTELIQTVIKAEEYRGAKWYQTGDWIWSHKGSFTDSGKDSKGNRKVAWNLLDTKSGGVELPETVAHHKKVDSDGKPEMVKLRNNSGKVQWSVWKMTRRWTQNIADIFNAIELAGWDAVFPGGKLVDRSTLAELMKKPSSPEAPIDTFRRSLELAGKKLEECPADKASKAAIEAMMVEINSLYAEWKA